MRRRFGRVCLPCFLFFLLAGLAFMPSGKAAAARSSAALKKQSVSRIVVNSLANPTDASGSSITLTDALAQAARDPKDNLIEFDPAVVGSDPVTLVLAKPLVIESKESGNDRIDGGHIKGGLILDASACGDGGVIVGGKGRLMLANLTLRGGKHRVVLVKDSGKITLEQVIIREGSMPGIALFGEAEATLVQCKLIGNKTHGLELHGRSKARLDRVELSQNAQSGVACFDRAQAAIRDSKFDNNGEWGIVLADESQGELLRCGLRGARFAIADVSGAAQLRCQSSSMEGAKRFGIFASGRSAIELADCTIRGHGSRGIEAQDRTTLKLDQSRIESNDEYGLILFGQAAVSAKGSFFSENGAHGASLRSRAGGHFTDCAFIANRYSGVGCLDAHEGGDVVVSQCIFRQNGMRPIYRGPLHIDPIVPTPLSVDGKKVTCLADPNATIELYLDRAGEASRYLKTIGADERGHFQVELADVPDGWVITATATVEGATSEFNVVAGSNPGPVLDALLGRTGPLSDDGGEVNLDTLLRRWKPETKIIFSLEKPPSVAIERYMWFLVQRIRDWTGGAIEGGLKIGALEAAPADAILIPVRYVAADSNQLMGRGGVTFMKWDSSGYFLTPMEIMLAMGQESAECCPRVLAHEVGHALGLSHARVGLLSRMQGSAPPSKSFVNDFAPTMTFYDVLALQALHDPRNTTGMTLRQLIERGMVPHGSGGEVVWLRGPAGEPSFSPPPAEEPQTFRPRVTNRP